MWSALWAQPLMREYCEILDCQWISDKVHSALPVPLYLPTSQSLFYFHHISNTPPFILVFPSFHPSSLSPCSTDFHLHVTMILSSFTYSFLTPFLFPLFHASTFCTYALGHYLAERWCWRDLCHKKQGFPKDHPPGSWYKAPHPSFHQSCMHTQHPPTACTTSSEIHLQSWQSPSPAYPSSPPQPSSSPKPSHMTLACWF